VERGHQVTVYVRPYVDVRDVHRASSPVSAVPSRRHTRRVDAYLPGHAGRCSRMWTSFSILRQIRVSPLPRASRDEDGRPGPRPDWQREVVVVRQPLSAGCRTPAVYFHRPSLSRRPRRYSRKYRRPVDYPPTGVGIWAPRREIGKGGSRRELHPVPPAVPEKGCHYLIEAYGMAGAG
jgi:hypothetical protein